MTNQSSATAPSSPGDHESISDLLDGMQSLVEMLFAAALSLSALPPDRELTAQDRHRVVAATAALETALSEMRALGASTET